MIKLMRGPKPPELTEELQIELTEKFKLNGETVWQLTFLKNSLISFSDNKCCYCECKLGEESKFLEVEHFHCKHLYPDEVLEWINLLPACKRCNGKKLDHDTINEPIIDPTINSPSDELFFRAYQIRGKTLLGRTTVEVLDLNNTDRLTLVRFKIGETIIQQLNILLELTQEYSNVNGRSTRRKNRIYSSLEKLLLESCPDTEYSATAATILLNEENYSIIKTLFIENSLWDNNLQNLENKATFCSLEIL